MSAPLGLTLVGYLNVLRTELDISVPELAELVGIDHSYLAQVFAGSSAEPVPPDRWHGDELHASLLVALGQAANERRQRDGRQGRHLRVVS